MRELLDNWQGLGKLAGTMLMVPAVLAIGIMAVSHFSWNKLIVQEIPLLDMAMEIKVELERTHMSLHEMERGLLMMRNLKHDPKLLEETHDQVILSVDRALESINNLNTYVDLSQQGTTTLGSVSLSRIRVKKTSDEELNKRLEELRVAIETLSEYLLPNLQGAAYQNFIYDPNNDVMFEEALEYAQATDDRVHALTKERLDLQQRLFLLFIIAFGMFTAYIFFKWRTLSREHSNTLADLYLTSRAVDHSADAIMITDNRGIIDYVNPSLTTFTGFSADELVGNHFSILNHGERTLDSEAWPVVMGNEEWRDMLSFTASNGSMLLASVCASPMPDKSGKVAFCVITIHPSTDKR